LIPPTPRRGPTAAVSEGHGNSAEGNSSPGARRCARPSHSGVFHGPSSPAFLSEKEAATYLYVSLSTIRRRRRFKTGPAFFRYGGVLRYRRAALEEFITKNTQTAA